MTAPAKQPLTLAAIPADTRCLIYTRVSTEDQATEDRASLAVQERECRALAAAHGFRDAVLWPPDHESGRSTARLERLAQWGEAHPRPANARGLVVVLKADRWGRFVHDEHASAYYQYRLARAGWDVDFALEPKSENRTIRRLTAAVHEVQGEEESVEKGRRARMGMDQQAQLGHWQSRAPFGYVRVGVHLHSKRERVLAPGEHASGDERNTLQPGSTRDVDTVRTIFRQYAAGATLATIADGLNAAKVRGPWRDYRNRGGTQCWTPGTVRVILANPAYLGTVRFGRRGRRAVEEWIVVGHAHDPLIDPTIWQTVQRRLARIGPRQRGDSSFVLTGLVRCKTCENLVTGGGGAPNSYYRDRGGVRYPAVCRPTLMVGQRWLEGQVIQCVATVALRARRKGFLAKLEREVRRQVAAGDATPAPTDLDRERRDLEAQRKRIVEQIGKGRISADDAADRLGEIKADLGRIQEASHRDRFDAAARTATLARTIDLTRTFLQDAAFRAERLARVPSALLREWLQGWVVGVTLDKVRRVAEIAVRRLPECPRDTIGHRGRAR